MSSKTPAAWTLSVFATLLLVFRVVCTGQTLQTEIQHPAAKSFETGDPEAREYKVDFGIKLTNRSLSSISLPSPTSAGSNSFRFTLTAVEALPAGQMWKYISQASWYGDSTTKYDACVSLETGHLFQYNALSGSLLLLRKQLAELGGAPMIRLSLMFYCQAADGTVLTTGVTTEAFTLQLPQGK